MRQHPRTPFTDAKQIPVHIRVALGLCFFASGAAGLTYEVIWTKKLALVMGSTVFSMSTVLGTFMGGLALGSFWAGKTVKRSWKNLRIYGLLEIGIGLSCLAVPLMISASEPLFRYLYQNWMGSFLSFNLLRFLVCALILLIPTTMMGATLPIMINSWDPKTDNFGRTVSNLYGLNTFGAAFGALLAGFLLIPTLGIFLSTLTAAAVNIGLGIISIFLAGTLRHYAATEESGDGEKIPRLPPTADAISPMPLNSGDAKEMAEKDDLFISTRGMMFGIFLAGFTGMLLQIAWTRALSLFISSSTYAFSMIVCVFILGLGLGSILIAPVLDRIKSLAMLFAVTNLLAAFGVWVSSFLLGEKFPLWIVDIVSTTLETAPPESAYSIVMNRQFGLIMLLFLFPTTLLGMAFPIVAKAHERCTGKSGESIGNVYAFNTVGSIAGSLIGGFLILPLAQVDKTLLFCVLMYSAIAAISAVLSRKTWGMVFGLCSLGIGLCLFLFGSAWNPSVKNAGVYLYAAEYAAKMKEKNIDLKELLEATHKIIFSEDGISASVCVQQNLNNEDQMSLRVNGKADASTGDDMLTQLSLAYTPMCFKPDAKKVLVIGFGSGITSGAVARFPVETIDSVEISPEVARAAKQCFGKFNLNVLDDPRHRLIEWDGRNHLNLTKETYDVIISEPSNPWIAGIGSLFTVESFEVGKSRLADEGIFCQWLHLYSITEKDFKVVARTFSSVFEHSLLFTAFDGDVLMLGSRVPFELDVDKLAFAWGNPKISNPLALAGYKTPQDFLSHARLADGALKTYAGKGILNTDDNSYLQYSAPNSLYMLLDSNLTGIWKGLLEFEKEYPIPLRTSLPEENALSLKKVFDEQWKAKQAYYLFQVKLLEIRRNRRAATENLPNTAELIQYFMEYQESGLPFNRDFLIKALPYLKELRPDYFIQQGDWEKAGKLFGYQSLLDEDWPIEVAYASQIYADIMASGKADPRLPGLSWKNLQSLFESASKVSPEFAMFKIQLAQALFEEGGEENLKKAGEIIEKINPAKLKDSLTLVALALYFNKADKEKTLDGILQSALAFCGGKEKSAKACMRLLILLDRQFEGIPFLEEFLKQNPESAWAVDLLNKLNERKQ